ncbi:hypothetical protein [Microbacterium maritypicum]
MRSTPLSLAALAATALLLTSCAGASASGSAGGDTVEVTTPTGAEISMPAEPQAALGFYTTDLDILITLGFELADTQPIRDDFTAFPDFFPQEELEGLETFGNFPEFNLRGGPRRPAGLHPQRTRLREGPRRPAAEDRPDLHVQRLRRRRLA